jgi:hypothetical protein
MCDIAALGAFLELPVKIVVFQTFTAGVFERALKATFGTRLTSLWPQCVSANIVSLLTESTC